MDTTNKHYYYIIPKEGKPAVVHAIFSPENISWYENVDKDFLRDLGDFSPWATPVLQDPFTVTSEGKVIFQLTDPEQCAEVMRRMLQPVVPPAIEFTNTMSISRHDHLITSP